MRPVARALCIAVAVVVVACGVLVETPRAWAIVGGHPATQGEFPFMLSLERKTANGSSFSCGAVLITPLTALTAAHCVDAVSASSLLVRSGSLHRSNGGSLTAVTKVIRHPGYNSNTHDNDIAVLHLAALGSDLTPAVLPAPGEDPQGGTAVNIAGWGTTKQGGTLSANLMTVHYPVVGRKKCNDDYKEASGGDDMISDQMFCTGAPAGAKGACQGDDGGPVLSGSTVVGIISWRHSCAQPNFPDVNTRVGSFVPWILANSATP